jgi:hypothetical protein
LPTRLSHLLIFNVYLIRSYIRIYHRDTTSHHIITPTLASCFTRALRCHHMLFRFRLQVATATKAT